jgi:anti-anti-sigma factor
MIEREDRDGRVVLRIKGSMSVFDIDSAYKEIAKCFDECNDLALNLKEVDDCDISGLQLLCSAWKTANSSGKTFSIDDASNSIIDTFYKAGLDFEAVFADKSKIQNQRNNKEVSNGQGHHDGG